MFAAGNAKTAVGAVLRCVLLVVGAVIRCVLLVVGAVLLLVDMTGQGRIK